MILCHERTRRGLDLDAGPESLDGRAAENVPEEMDSVTINTDQTG